MDKTQLDEFILLAIKEDIGDGDHTSLACIPADKEGTSQLLVKQDGILAGIEISKRVFELIDPSLQLDIFLVDGTAIKKGDIAFRVQGNSQRILLAERLVLNIMQRMSGIATETNRYVRELEGLATKVLDTRKTTPGMRMLEKMAVKIGGGENHRFGLFDMIMIKDNHVDFAGGITQAIESTQKYLNDTQRNLKIEIEVRNMEELHQVLDYGKVDRIMLDNFTPEQTKIAVEFIDKRYETESSGQIKLETIRSYALAGVDYVSVGALTHQISSLDLSLKAIDE